MKSLQWLVLAACLSSVATHATTLPPLPVARDDNYLLNSLVLNVPGPGLLANDSGTDLLVSSFFDPTDGTLNSVVTNGSFQFTPSRGFAGISTFDYSVLDRFGRSSTATVSIDASRSVPIANDDYFTPDSAVFSVGSPGLLGNDSGGIGSLIVSSFFDPSAGTLNRVVTDGSFEYVAPRGFDGVASFVYSNLDELGRSASASVFLDYGASIPVAFDDMFSVLSGETLDIFAPGLLSNDVGGIGSLIVSSFFDPAEGVLERVVTDGSFRYLAPAGFSGLDTFSYAILDDLGRASMATVSIQVGVSAVPEPPQALLMLMGLALMAATIRRRSSV